MSVAMTNSATRHTRAFIPSSETVGNSTLGCTRSSQASLELGEQFGWINPARYQPLVKQLTAQCIDHGPIALDAVRPPILSHECLSLLQVSEQPGRGLAEKLGVFVPTALRFFQTFVDCTCHIRMLLMEITFNAHDMMPGKYARPL